MGLPRFARPKGVDGESSPNLYVANCGPAVGLSFDTIASVFGIFGKVKGAYAADESGTRVIVSYFEESSAQAALKALDGHPCPDLGGRFLHIRYSILQPSCQVQVSDSVPVSLVASELNIPGIYLLHDFVTAKEEEELLAAVDDRPWKTLSKRRVQHYGYEFCYEAVRICYSLAAIYLAMGRYRLEPRGKIFNGSDCLSSPILDDLMMRNINTKQRLGELPSFVSPILERISSFPNLDGAANVVLDQLTVNEYPPGVGLSPHIDTHAAFEGLIFSLSLAGPCIMEFRRYSEGVWIPKPATSTDMKVEIPDNCSNFLRRAIYLPPRSMLLLSGEARYAWHHYIPHHKVDMVKDNVIRRGSRRVSFTIRKVRTCPCRCEFPPYCDSQR